MEGDAKSLVEVTLYVSASMVYSRLASSLTHPGLIRLLTLLPVLILLPSLPFHFTSIHLRGISAFFLCWLGIFKLLLLSFGHGPLSPSLPFLTFIATASLPVKLRPNSSKKQDTKKGTRLPVVVSLTIIKLLLFTFIISLYNHKSTMHPYVLFFIRSCHVYLALDLVLLSSAFLPAIFGLDLEPQFDAPLKSKSLQEFWGRRWNLMVTGILRPSVYSPMNSRFGMPVAVISTFVVSGLMHEYMFYYLTFERPSGEVTCFFVLHGVATVVEVWARRKGWWRPSQVVAVPLVLGFVVVTAFWLFFPPLTKGGADEIVEEECRVMVGLLVESGRKVVDRIMGLKIGW